MKKIEQSYSYYNRDTTLQYLEHSNESEIKDLFLGRKVVAVDDDHLELDDGTVIRVLPNGGCSCGAGDYALESLSRVDNIITKVEFDYQPTGDYGDYTEEDGFYRIYVYADNERINLLSVSGDDGNGYYGTGFELLVRRVTVG